MLFPTEIWKYIISYMGIGEFWYLLTPLTTKQLKNLTIFTFQYPESVPSFCPLSTNKSQFIKIFINKLNEYDSNKRSILENTAKQIIMNCRIDLENMRTHKDYLVLRSKVYNIFRNHPLL
jgi:hypothetical protein